MLVKSGKFSSLLPKLARNWYLSISLLLLFIIIIAIIVVATARMTDEYYQPSNYQTFEYGNPARTFSAYLEHQREQIRQFRIPLNPEQLSQEIDLVAPFEISSIQTCSQNKKIGILLVHGLLETPFGMRDLAQQLATPDCRLVRTVLLPGHATRPGDLIKVSRDRWRDVVDYGIRSLHAEVDSIYLIGFSLGAAINLEQALQIQSNSNHKLAGLILLAPAIQLPDNLLIPLTGVIKYVRTWLDQVQQITPVRYSSLSINAIAETYGIGKATRRRLADTPLQVPTLLVASHQDNVVNGLTAVERFAQQMPHPLGEAIFYSPQAKIRIAADDARIEYRDSFLPNHKVVNFSHLTLPYSPTNPIYGESGSYRECGEAFSNINAEQTEECQSTTAADSWKGEMTNNPNQEHAPLQRLTYNPEFDLLITRIENFISRTSR